MNEQVVFCGDVQFIRYQPSIEVQVSQESRGFTSTENITSFKM